MIANCSFTLNSVSHSVRAESVVSSQLVWKLFRAQEIIRRGLALYYVKNWTNFLKKVLN